MSEVLPHIIHYQTDIQCPVSLCKNVFLFSIFNIVYAFEPTTGSVRSFTPPLESLNSQLHVYTIAQYLYKTHFSDDGKYFLLTGSIGLSSGRSYHLIIYEISKDLDTCTPRGRQILKEEWFKTAENFVFFDIDELIFHPTLPVLAGVCLTSQIVLLWCFASGW